MTRERRLQGRAIPAELGFIQISGDEGGRIVNISEAGLCFETFAPVERQRRLQFWFSLNLRERVEASGKLAWLDAGGKVGGLRFLDLSAKARRHLHTCLGARHEDTLEAPSAKLTTLLGALGKPSFASSIEPQKSPALTLQEADFVPSRWLEASTAGPQPALDSADRDRKEEAQAKGTVFFSALAATRMLRERADASETDNPVVLHEANSGPRDSAGGGGFERSAIQPALTFASTRDVTSMVPLEWHLKDSRRQLRRGILLGAAVSLAFAIAAGTYLVRKPRGSQAGVSPAVASAPAVTPGTQAISGASETTSATGISLKPESNPLAPPTRSSPDNLQQKAAFVSSSSSAAIRRAKEAGTTESRGAEAKPAAKKSSATPQQLWAAIQKGNTRAAVELADRFLQGDGVPVNCDQARVLFLFASEKNNADAIRKLHELDQTGCPKP